MPYLRPPLVSERERAHRWPDGQYDDSRWEDCGPCSVLMASLATGVDAPATLTEAEAVRAAAGYPPSGGTNIQRLSAAAVLRYRMRLPRHVTGALQIITALVPGTGAALAGSMGNFPAGHRLRRWQPTFTGTHSVYVGRESTTRRWAWIDPLAPQGAYSGEWVTEDELRTFFRGPVAAAVVVQLARVA